MTVPGDIKNFLDDQGISYEVVTHREVFSSDEEARVTGETPSHVAKTLVIRTRSGDVLAVAPASERVDIHKLRDVLNDNHARLATEDEMARDYSQYELGAVPPIGELVGNTVVLDRQLEQADQILFAAGTHSDSIRMSGEDFLKLVRPHVADLIEEQEGKEGFY
ncbi:MAG: YbaK/EbsC family protein [Thermoleophilia bacterium]|nr:YbaK/EbsC family protein [Thermoleophilia bacterium]